VKKPDYYLFHVFRSPRSTMRSWSSLPISWWSRPTQFQHNHLGSCITIYHSSLATATTYLEHRNTSYSSRSIFTSTHQWTEGLLISSTTRLGTTIFDLHHHKFSHEVMLCPAGFRTKPHGESNSGSLDVSHTVYTLCTSPIQSHRPVYTRSIHNRVQ